MASPGGLELSKFAAVERYRALLQVSESIASHRDLPELFRSLAALLHRLITFDLSASPFQTWRVAWCGCMCWKVLFPPVSSRARDSHGGERSPIGLGESAAVGDFPLERDGRFPVVSDLLRQDGVQSLCVLPLTTAQRRVGAMESVR